MALTATFYKFSKKKNSTARPSTGTDFNIELKDMTNILNPSITLKVATYPDYNYCYIAEFDRYYFVQDIVWEKAVWSMNLEVDPLASWKNTIGGHTLYVTRSAAASNGDIMDEVYPTKKDPKQTLVPPTSGGSPWSYADIESTTFVVGIIGNDVTYYAFAPTNYGSFMRKLYATTYLDQIVPSWASDFQDIKSRINPLQYITSVMWFPVNFWTATATTVDVGYGTIDTNCRVLDIDETISVQRSFLIPEHPQAATRGDYLNTRPYSDYRIFFPPFGQFVLNPDIVADSESNLIDAFIDIDVRTGEATLSVQCGFAGSNLLTWANAKVGVNYQVSQVMNSGMSLGQLAQTGASLVAGGIFGGAIGVAGAAIAGGASAIGNYINGKIPSANMVGSQGGVNSLQGVPQLLVEQYEIVDEDNANRGRPLCELRTISSLSGYMVVEPANVSIPAQSSELDAIKTYMEGGFYYE